MPALVGKIDSDLIRWSITPEGLILKPSRPLAVPDFLIATQTKDSDIVQLETLSEISGWNFGILLLNGKGPLDLAMKNYQFHQQKSYLAYTYHHINKLTPINEDSYDVWPDNKNLTVNVGTLTVSTHEWVTGCPITLVV